MQPFSPALPRGDSREGILISCRLFSSFFPLGSASPPSALGRCDSGHEMGQRSHLVGAQREARLIPCRTLTLPVTTSRCSFPAHLPQKPLPWAMPSLGPECEAQIGSLGMKSEQRGSTPFPRWPLPLYLHSLEDDLSDVRAVGS